MYYNMPLRVQKITVKAQWEKLTKKNINKQTGQHNKHKGDQPYDNKVN